MMSDGTSMLFRWVAAATTGSELRESLTKKKLKRDSFAWNETTSLKITG